MNMELMVEGGGRGVGRWYVGSGGEGYVGGVEKVGWGGVKKSGVGVSGVGCAFPSRGLRRWRLRVVKTKI